MSLPLTDATSYQTWFWVAGILNLLIGLGGFLVPALMNIEDNHKNKATEVPEPAQEAPQVV
jgi:hypothetical protein